MSSPATRLRWSARLALAATALSVAGCQNYAARRDTIAFHAGEAAAYNKAVHTIDPWPAAAARADIPLDGPRAVRAIERYEQGAPAVSNGANGGTSMPAPGASATGGP